MLQYFYIKKLQLQFSRHWEFNYQGKLKAFKMESKWVIWMTSSVQPVATYIYKRKGTSDAPFAGLLVNEQYFSHNKSVYSTFSHSLSVRRCLVAQLDTIAFKYSQITCYYCRCNEQSCYLCTNSSKILNSHRQSFHTHRATIQPPFLSFLTVKFSWIPMNRTIEER